MLLARHAARFVGDLWLFALRSGRWWVPLLVVVLVVVTAISATAKVVVPVATYTLF